MMKPTVGRVVLFHEAGVSQEEAWPALICKVNADDNINVGGFKANGQPFAATSVRFYGDPERSGVPADGSWAEPPLCRDGSVTATEQPEHAPAITDKHAKAHKSHK